MDEHISCENINTTIDTEMLTENVTFIGSCFDNSFTFQLNDENLINGQENKFSANIACSTNNNFLSEKSIKVKGKAHLSSNSSFKSKFIKCWGLPNEIVYQYEKKGITEMFAWQVECLGNSKVLLDYGNLVYSAPTSAGKTLIAEIIGIKTVLERQKKVIIILPFVSVVREKMVYLQDILSSSGIRVEGFMGSHAPAGGFQAVHVAICTIEKANALVNKLMDEDNIADLGAVIVDEMHLLGDSHRGYILELLLTKIKYMSKAHQVQIQIVAMSATFPNIEMLAKWLDAELYVTQFRPIPLEEFCLVSDKLFNKKGECVSTIKNTIDLITENNSLLHICLETIKDNCSVLIFCMTKNWCENLAQLIASKFCKIGFMNIEFGIVLRSQLKSELISQVLEQLRNCPVGLDEVLKKTISFGVAYHHAGLTHDERDIVENGFKSGAIRVLVATSTLSSGVNLPARKVIIRTPVFQKQVINILTYKQMVGRAGRMGKDKKGESILFCSESEKNIGFNLMKGKLEPVRSCLESDDKYLRAILEVIASRVANTISELALYEKCTLNFYENDFNNEQQSLLSETLEQLKCLELIRVQNEGTDEHFVATALGKACLSSSMAPHDGLSLFCELQKARQCLVLETDLHLIYLVTPYSVSNQWGDIDWLHLFNLWESLTSAMKRVGQLIGVRESFIIRCMRTTGLVCHMQHRILVHKRFYTALALQDLINEMPLSDVANKFKCSRGFLQSLQQSAATFAGMVTAFCRQLGWKNMEMLMSQFQDRLHFGIHVELLDLMKLSSMNGLRARSLFDAGFETVSDIATADVNAIENALYSAVPFQSEKDIEGDGINDMKKEKKLKNIWITGFCGMTVRQAAETLILEAREHLKREIGVCEIKWNNEHNEVTKNCMQLRPEFDDKNISSSAAKATSMVSSIKGKREEKRNITQINIDDQCNEGFQRNIKEKYSTNNYNTIVVNNQNILKPRINNTKFENGTNTNQCSMQNIGNKIPKIVIVSENVTCEKNNICNETNIKNQLNNHEMRIPLEEKMYTSLQNTSDNNIIINMNSNKTSFRLDLKHDSKILDKISNDSLFNDTTWNPIETSKDLLPIDSVDDKEEDEALASEKHFIVLEDIKSNSKMDKNESFSFSEGDNNSSLFEESLPLDLLPSKLFDNNTIKNSTPNNSFNSVNPNNVIDIKFSTLSLANAFNYSFGKIEDNLKLTCDHEKSTISNCSLFQENSHIISDKVIVVDSSYKENLQDSRDTQWTTKHNKLEYKNELSSALQSVIEKSRLFTIQINSMQLKYIILSDNDFITQEIFTTNFKEVSICFVIENNNQSQNIIGYHYIRENMNDLEKINNISQTLVGVAIYIGENFCIFYDITKSNSLVTGLRIWMENINLTLKLYSTKYNYVNLKRYVGLNLLPSIIDISLSEWLIDNEEKEAPLNNLIKKYCDFDVHSLIENEKHSELSHCKSIESACIKAWAIWQISEKQKNCLQHKYDNIQKILGK